MTKKPILLMLKGLPGSGKTHHAQTLVKEGWVRVNKDDIRAVKFPFWEFKDEAAVIEMEDDIIVHALEQGRNVVVDDTNFVLKHRLRLEALAQENGAEFQVLFIDTPLETCIKRNRQRAKSVPMDVIIGMYNKYVAVLHDTKVVQDDELSECIIIDVDGTLAHINPEDKRGVYDASRANEDLVDDAVSVVLAMAYKNGYQVFILTGRKEEHLGVTKEWLEDNGISYDEIYCRADDDDRPDYIVKREIYENHIQRRYRVKFVIDDRPSVCRMWRSLGFTVFQVGDPHNEF